MSDAGLTTTMREFARLAILFADVSGSTRLYERLGDSKAKRIVDRCLGLLRREVERYNGRIVKHIGDELLCTFEDPQLAAVASTAMQDALRQAASRSLFGEEDLAIRVGFHFGIVILDGGDVFGDAVNTAARVVAQAKKHQVLTTKETLALLPPEVQSGTRFVDRFALRGKRQELEIYEVLWDVTDLTVAPGHLHEPERGDLRLQLRYQDLRIDLGPGRAVASLGRGRDNDIVVQDNQSSRFHARVEFRKSRFYLVDLSLNGTYVRIDGDEEVCLRHEELPLKGEGVISLGRPVDAEPRLQITFFVGTPPSGQS